MKTLLPLLFALAGLLPSCVAPMYIPASLPVAFHDTSGQVDIRVGARNVQLSASVSNHIAVKLNGHNGEYEHNETPFGGDHDPKSTSKNTLYSGNIGVEYFDSKKMDDKIIFTKQVCSGVGIGSIDYHYKTSFVSYTNLEYSLKSRFTSVYLQPGLTVKAIDKIGVNLSARFTGMFYHVTRFATANYDEYKTAYLGNRNLKKTGPFKEFNLPVDFRNRNNAFYLFAEPAITVRFFANKWFFIQAQLGYSICLNNPQMDGRNHFLEFCLGLRFFRSGKCPT